MSLNDSLTDYERSLLAVWTYPISDKFTKFWHSMTENKPVKSLDEAVMRLRRGLGRTGRQKFAFIGNSLMKSPSTLPIPEDFQKFPIFCIFFRS